MRGEKGGNSVKRTEEISLRAILHHDREHAGGLIEAEKGNEVVALSLAKEGSELRGRGRREGTDSSTSISIFQVKTAPSVSGLMGMSLKRRVRNKMKMKGAG